MTTSPLPRWLPLTLALAGIWNLLFAAFVLASPLAIFAWLRLREPYYVELWQALGAISGVQGIGFLIAARDPVRHWAIVLVGLLTKLLAPLAFLLSVWRNELPSGIGWIVLVNDGLWWIPFACVLWHARRAERRAQQEPAPARRPAASPALVRLQQILQTLSAPAPTQARLFPDLERRLSELAHAYTERLAEVTAQELLEPRQLAGLRAAGERLHELAAPTLVAGSSTLPDHDAWARMRAAARAALAQFGWSIDIPLQELRAN